MQEGMTGTLAIRLNADADERTIGLVATPSANASWSAGGRWRGIWRSRWRGARRVGDPALVRSARWSRPIIFGAIRRADKVIRMDADVGLSGGRWVVIASGVREGDEIVLDGAYRVVLATAVGRARLLSGGMFHGGALQTCLLT